MTVNVMFNHNFVFDYANLGAITDLANWRKLIEQNPIAAWVDGRGMGGHCYFTYDGFTFRTTFELPDDLSEDFREFVREIVDWRMAAYLQRPSVNVSDAN